MSFFTTPRGIYQLTAGQTEAWDMVRAIAEIGPEAAVSQVEESGWGLLTTARADEMTLSGLPSRRISDVARELVACGAITEVRSRTGVLIGWRLTDEVIARLVLDTRLDALYLGATKPEWLRERAGLEASRG